MSSSIQNFYKTKLTRNWSATTGDFNVSVKPTISSGLLVISSDNPTLREIIRYTATGTNSYGDFVTVSNLSDRGIGGTTAQTHSIGETIKMNITAEHWQEMQDDINSIIAAELPAGTDGQIIGNTSGNWVAKDLDDIITEDLIRTTTVSLSSADILALHTTPKELIPAPGAGKIIIVDEAIFSFTAGTQYVNGQNLDVKYTGDSVRLLPQIGNAILLSASNSINIRVSGTATSASNVVATAGVNAAVSLNLESATAYITGTGTLKVFIKYRILTL